MSVYLDLLRNEPFYYDCFIIFDLNTNPKQRDYLSRVVWANNLLSAVLVKLYNVLYQY